MIPKTENTPIKMTLISATNTTKRIVRPIITRHLSQFRWTPVMRSIWCGQYGLGVTVQSPLGLAPFAQMSPETGYT